MHLNDIPILSVVTYVPLAGALLLVFFVGREKTGAIQTIATAVAGLDFLLSIPLWFAFDRGKAGYQFVERASWIPSLGVEYHFGIDGISLLLILLTTFFLVRDGRVRGIAFMETIVRPLTWDDWPAWARDMFQAFRRPGEGDRDEQQRQAEQRGDHEPGHEADDPARDLCRRAS